MVLNDISNATEYEADGLKAEIGEVFFIKTDYEVYDITDSDAATDLPGFDSTKDAIKDFHKSPKRSVFKKLCIGRYWHFFAVVSCFLGSAMVGCLTNSYGVLYTYMQGPLGLSEVELSLIGSLMTGFSGLACPVATVIIDNFGCRVACFWGALLFAAGFAVASFLTNIYLLYAFLGILPGFGVCLVYASTTIHLPRLFTKWRPFAVAIGTIGSGFGLILGPVLSTVLAEAYGWRGAILILGGLTLHLLLCALWIKPTNHKQPRACPPKRKMSRRESVSNYFQIFKRIDTTLLCVVSLLAGTGYYTLPTFIPSYIINTRPDMTSSDSALIISLSGIGSIVGRIIYAGAAMAHVRAPEMIFMFSMLMSGISLLMVPFCGSLATFIASGMLNGCMLGGWNSMASVVLVNIFGIDSLSQIFGLYIAVMGFGAMAGAPLESFLVVVTGDNGMIFYSSGCFLVLSAVIVSIAILKSRKPSSTDIHPVGDENA